ncbi:hypothetical protein MKL09_23505 [Methylobacterium sp. J-048]|uniref:hypothetical protein n=1 Tax=Methylobacterium sp. J-048 TaxID=2836635 RepID=UPI001FBBB00F|nr:hypothetical protein [Methylobacterium sp. J-048]MCJ2059494.1 hypothetical protein [Methylobacterium sp. J-048]
MWKPVIFLLSMFLAVAAAQAKDVPHFDIEAICREAPSLGQSMKSTDQGCIHDETQARAQVGQQWSRFTSQHRDECVQEATIGGPPSYVALLTCLQM